MNRNPPGVNGLRQHLAGDGGAEGWALYSGGLRNPKQRQEHRLSNRMKRKRHEMAHPIIRTADARTCLTIF